MTLKFLYANRSGSYSVDLGTSAVRLGKVALTQSAEMGNISTSTLEIDDPTGTAGHSGDQILPYNTIDVIEDAAPSGNQLIGSWYTQDREYYSEDSLNTGTAVRISVELADLNHTANDPVIQKSGGGNRPAETVGARLTWLIASAYSNFFDIGLVEYPTTLMDAVDYTNQQAANVLDDCSQHTGYTWFLYKDETATVGQQTGLAFFNFNTSTLYTSSLRLSNVLADIDSDWAADGATHTYAPFGVRLRRSPKTMARGIVLPYQGGTVYVTRTATQDLIGNVDVVAADANVKSSAAAMLRANRLLWEASTEEDSITCSVMVPKAHVNDVRHGQRLHAKFRQIPNYKSDFTYFRVLDRTVKQEALTDEFYTLDLTLSPQEPAEPVAGIVQQQFVGGGSGGVDIALPNPVTIGNILVVMENAWKADATGEPVAPYTSGGAAPALGGTGAWTQRDITVRTLAPGGVDYSCIKCWTKVADGTEQYGKIFTAATWAWVYELANCTLSGLATASVTVPGLATNLDVGSLGTAAANDISIMAVAQYTDVGGTVGFSSTFAVDGEWPYVYFSSPRPTWGGHFTGTAGALDAKVTSTVAANWCGIAIRIPSL